MKKKPARPHKGGIATFIIDVKHTRNATWQGTITWAESGEEQNFRSVLELVKLMDSAVAVTNEKRAEELNGVLDQLPELTDCVS